MGSGRALEAACAPVLIVFRDSHFVEEVLAHAVDRLDEKVALSALILTGGTTAYTVCRRMGIKRLQLRQRISWGVVLSQASELSGMAVAVKGGSLGEAEAFHKTVETVRSLT